MAPSTILNPAVPGLPAIAWREINKRAARAGLPLRLVHGALAKFKTQEFEKTALYQRVFELGDRVAGRPLRRAIVPRIELEEPEDHASADDRLVRSPRRFPIQTAFRAVRTRPERVQLELIATYPPSPINPAPDACH